MDSGKPGDYSGTENAHELAALAAELIELERKLIPLLNRVREMLGKPAIIVPKDKRH